MQIPIVNGVVANERAEFELAYPLNLEPLIVDSKISRGQLRSAHGAKLFATGPGIDRGAIVWDDVMYRVMGDKLVKVNASGFVTRLGDIPGTGPVSIDYSFDRLIIRSGTALYYYDLTGVTQVTDVDLGQVRDAIWIDGYTMATDGKFVVVTELSDPYQVKPLKYGSAEDDPDPITGLIRSRGEAFVLGRHTIETFSNVGGNGFPFRTVPGATIPIGCVGANAKTLFGETFAYVGSGRGDALAVYIAGQGTATKVSTRAVEDALTRVVDPTAIEVERQVSRDEYRMIVHLPDETWVYLAKASQRAEEPIWYRRQSGVDQPYRLRHLARAYGNEYVGDTVSSAIGVVDPEPAQFGEAAQWGFDAGMLYNGGKGAIVDRVELVGNSGRGDTSGGSAVFMSMTRDGQTFSPERSVSGGAAGQRGKRVEWRPHVRVRSFMGLRFRGLSKATVGFAACEVAARPLTA